MTDRRTWKSRSPASKAAALSAFAAKGSTAGTQMRGVDVPGQGSQPRPAVTLLALGGPTLCGLTSGQHGVDSL